MVHPPAVLLLLNSTLIACLFHAYEHETAAVAELSSDAIHILMCQIQNTYDISYIFYIYFRYVWYSNRPVHGTHIL